jgi:SAM-dependent MidA family methyltransferase
MPRAPSSNSDASLPAPTPEAREHSARVVAHITQSIEAAGGWISFADYMGEALYAPALGYYTAGARKFGAAGDFVTAPEMTPLFGRTLARQIADVLRRLPDAEVIELGPGTGRLASDVLAALSARGAMPSRYRLLEVSPELCERQRTHLASQIPALLPRVEWIDVLPPRWRGVVVANEVLDAVPPHLIARKNGAWFERGVTHDDGRLCFGDRPLTAEALRDAARLRFPPEEDYVSEINPAAQALTRSLAQRCDAGMLLLIDYGFPEAEYYHSQRSGGTLMAHYRHRTLDDPFFLPGLVDLTAHVDFSAIAHAGVSGGMVVGGYSTQARFLVNCGILDELASCGPIQSTTYLREAAAVQRLLSPAEMGELFKVLVLLRGVGEDVVEFRDGDRAHRL